RRAAGNSPRDDEAIPSHQEGRGSARRGRGTRGRGTGQEAVVEILVGGNATPFPFLCCLQARTNSRVRPSFQTPFVVQLSRLWQSGQLTGLATGQPATNNTVSPKPARAIHPQDA